LNALGTYKIGPVETRRFAVRVQLSMGHGVIARLTQASHDALVALVGSHHYEIMKTIRNKAAFHCVPDLARASLNDMTAKFPDELTTVRMGHEAFDWLVEAADVVMDRTVVRRIYNIPETANVREEADKIALKLQDITNTFGDFAGYFIKFHAGKS
jgi:hypothetical protein